MRYVELNGNSGLSTIILIVNSVHKSTLFHINELQHKRHYPISLCRMKTTLSRCHNLSYTKVAFIFVFIYCCCIWRFNLELECEDAVILRKIFHIMNKILSRAKKYCLGQTLSISDHCFSSNFLQCK